MPERTAPCSSGFPTARCKTCPRPAPEGIAGQVHIAEAQCSRALLPLFRARIHQAKRLVVRPGLRGGKGEPLIRLRRWVADGVGPMRGGDPAHDPCGALLRRERVRKKKEDARHNQKHEPPHRLSSRLSQPASNCRGWLQILVTG